MTKPKLKWITNVFENAKPKIGQSQSQANQEEAEWLKDKILGEPSDAAKHIPGARGVYVLEELQDD